MTVRAFHRWLYLGYRRSAQIRHRFGRKVTRAGLLMLGIAFAAGGLGLDTNLSMAYQLFTLLAAMIVLALLWNFARPPVIPVERILPRLATAGTPFRYEIIASNPLRKPLRGLALLDDLGDPSPGMEEFINTPEPGEQKRNIFDRLFVYYRWMWLTGRREQPAPAEQPLPVLARGGVASVQMELTPRRRGYLRFLATEITSTDPFGLFRSRRRVSNPQSILVLPKRYPSPRQALPGTTAYQLGGVTMATSIGESGEFVSMRDYQRSDPPRRIHWKSSARADRLIVKEYEDEFFMRQALILDTFQDSQPDEVFEEAVSVAASFACTADTRDSLLDLMFVGPQAYCFTAGRGVGQVEQMLEVLACVQGTTEPRMEQLSELVARHLAEVSGCVCVLLAWDDSRQKLVAQIKRAGVPVLALVVAREEVLLDPGPMRDDPGRLRLLPVGRVAEGLARL